MTTRAMVGIVAVALAFGLAGQASAQTQSQKQLQRQAQLQPPEWDRIFRSVLPKRDQTQNQNQKQKARTPTRIVVRPAQYYRYDSTEFPRSDNLGFPGRSAVRQCASWLAAEHRPSGAVVMPHMRCWWARG